jgi:3-phenylpropionate/trans-cinnamate dioxygenase ferredoxin reductase subunit
VAAARVVIVGGGVAAHGAVAGLRQAGLRDEVVILSREGEPPYERPPLSKRYLLHEVQRPQLFLPPLEADMRLRREVVWIDADRHEVHLASGERLGYRRLLLATGARPRAFAGREDLLCLRELRDADRLRRVLDSGRPLDVVGAGFIGCEVAAVARLRGLPVTVYEALDQPLRRVLGPELGQWLAEVHRSRGVDLRTGVRELPPLGEEALVAIGSEPNVEVAAAAGIYCDAGIVVDALGRTSAPDVYAAGDCSRFQSPLFDVPIRVEHFQTAHRHGISVGRAMAGYERPFAEAPWFWSDQYDLNLQYVGGGLAWDRAVLRGRPGAPRLAPPFTAFFLRSGLLVGALGVNDGRTIGHARRLLENRIRVTVRQLSDPTVDLKRLA